LDILVAAGAASNGLARFGRVEQTTSFVPLTFRPKARRC
jgi:hypothetical protein